MRLNNSINIAGGGGYYTDDLDQIIQSFNDILTQHTISLNSLQQYVYELNKALEKKDEELNQMKKFINESKYTEFVEALASISTEEKSNE